MKNEQVLAPNEAGELKNIFSPKNIVFENVKKNIQYTVYKT